MLRQYVNTYHNTIAQQSADQTGAWKVQPIPNYRMYLTALQWDLRMYYTTSNYIRIIPDFAYLQHWELWIQQTVNSLGTPFSDITLSGGDEDNTHLRFFTPGFVEFDHLMLAVNDLNVIFTMSNNEHYFSVEYYLTILLSIDVIPV